MSDIPEFSKLAEALNPPTLMDTLIARGDLKIAYGRRPQIMLTREAAEILRTQYNIPVAQLADKALSEIGPFDFGEHTYSVNRGDLREIVGGTAEVQAIMTFAPQLNLLEEAQAVDKSAGVIKR